MNEFDVRAVRSHIPALASGVASFDGPGGLAVPDVADATRDALTSPIANRRTVTRPIATPTRSLGSPLGDGATCSAPTRGGSSSGRHDQLTYDAARALAKTWQSGDKVVITRLDHDVNVLPWLTVDDVAPRPGRSRHPLPA